MNNRQKKKLEKNIKALLLCNAITELDKNLFQKSNPHYKAKIKKYPIHEMITVKRMGNNIKFEVRENEYHHNIAHFHITIRGKGSGSYRIDDLSPIKSDLEHSSEKKVLEWARENRQLLVDIWNEYHGHRITVA